MQISTLRTSMAMATQKRSPVGKQPTRLGAPPFGVLLCAREQPGRASSPAPLFREIPYADLAAASANADSAAATSASRPATTS